MDALLGALLLSRAGLCYFSVSILGFWAFGTGVGDNVLLAFKAGPHQWVVTMATMLVVVHVAAAFQVGLAWGHLGGGGILGGGDDHPARVPGGLVLATCN